VKATLIVCATLDSCKCESINGRACAYTTSDRTAWKIFSSVWYREAMFQI